MSGTAESSVETSERLLEAAGPIFARDGFEGATLREICGVAGANVASVAYHFGDKMGLYRAVIRRVRETREREFPIEDPGGDAEERMLGLIRTMLARMLHCDEKSWQAQLMMREMQSPTEVFRELVEDYFRPLFDRLLSVLQELCGEPIPRHRLEQLAFSVVGQCLYYRVGAGVVNVLVPAERREAAFDPDSLSRHILAVTLSAANDFRRSPSESVFRRWCVPAPSSVTPPSDPSPASLPDE